jgi:hypothetical protein
MQRSTLHWTELATEEKMLFARTDQPDGTHNEYKMTAKHHGLFSDVLALLDPEFA